MSRLALLLAIVAAGLLNRAVGGRLLPSPSPSPFERAHRGALLYLQLVESSGEPREVAYAQRRRAHLLDEFLARLDDGRRA